MTSPAADSDTAPATPPKRPTWRDSLKVYGQPASLRMLALGFAAGLPLVLVLGTLSFRLREAGINRATIGHLSWVALAYGFKWAWAPLVDRLPLPVLTRVFGRRRSWLLLAQVAIAAGLYGMAVTDPRVALTPMVGFALMVAFASATQDIALDAFRIESAEMRAQAALAATYQTGYRLAMIWAGAGVLWLAAAQQGGALDGAAAGYDNAPWRWAYTIMAASMLVGVVTVLLSKEPAPQPLPPARNLGEWLQTAVVDPFADFFKRYRWQAALILLLIGTYRISDIVMGIMANPFYVDMGYTKSEVATVTKVYGIIMTLTGAWVGGVLSMRYGVMKILFFGALASAASNAMFSYLAVIGHNVWALTAVISAENLAGGIASAAFIAYLSSLTNISYSATQYALFSSLMLLFPKFLAGFSGDLVNAWGYHNFFLFSGLLGLPVLVLVVLAARMQKRGATP